MPNTVARARTGKQSGGTAPAVRPNVAIVRSAYNAPGTPGFERAYSYRQERVEHLTHHHLGQMKIMQRISAVITINFLHEGSSMKYFHNISMF